MPATSVGSVRPAWWRRRDIDDILALGARLRPLHATGDATSTRSCTLLESGANVVTTCGEFHHPGEHGRRSA